MYRATPLDYKTLAYLAYRMIEGDFVTDQVMIELENAGYVDTSGEWIYPEDGNE